MMGTRSPFFDVGGLCFMPENIAVVNKARELYEDARSRVPFSAKGIARSWDQLKPQEKAVWLEEATNALLAEQTLKKQMHLRRIQ